MVFNRFIPPFWREMLPQNFSYFQICGGGEFGIFWGGWISPLFPPENTPAKRFEKNSGFTLMGNSTNPRKSSMLELPLHFLPD
jgi:hypothetical protein